jgi:5-methylcytosine-specific restriction protein B
MPFVTACTKLNEKISNEPSLGPAYQIGHAFFSEIVDIYSDVKSEGKQKSWEVAKKVLWSISVRPTLDAYCGSMETEQKMQFIKICKDAFLPQVNVNVENSQSQQNDKQSSSENE